jgi:type I restriction enzyme M protein
VGPGTAGRHARYGLTAGDIVCPRTGTLGRYALVSSDEAGWLLGPGCMRIRPGDGVLPGYLLHYLNGSAARDWLMEHQTGSVIHQVNSGTLGELPITLPPIHVQRQIATTMEMVDRQIAEQDRIGAVSRKLRDFILPVLAEGRDLGATPDGS